MTEPTLIEMVTALRIEHTVCEDGWYSCPESEDGCIDITQHGCNCRAEEHNALVDKVLAMLGEMTVQ